MKHAQTPHENKSAAKQAKKNAPETPQEQPWFPDWRWHLKTLSIIYLLLIAGFFTTRHFLAKLEPPYNIRQLPSEMTPWLNPKNYPEP